MELNIDPQWLLEMAQKEDGGIISVGGFVARIQSSEQIMDLNTYQIESRKTAIYLDSVGRNLWYPTLKLTGEVGELTEAIAMDRDHLSILKEAGDILWYIAASCSEMGVELQSLADMRGNLGALSPVSSTLLLSVLGRISERVGKTYRDHVGDCDFYREEIVSNLAVVLLWLTEVAERLGSTIEEVAAMNRAKLADRKERGVLHGEGSDR